MKVTILDRKLIPFVFCYGPLLVPIELDEEKVRHLKQLGFNIEIHEDNKEEIMANILKPVKPSVKPTEEVTSKPATVVKPAPKPAVKPATEVKPAVKPAPKPATEVKPAPKPAAEIKPVPKPAPKPATEVKPAVKPEVKPEVDTTVVNDKMAEKKELESK